MLNSCMLCTLFMHNYAQHTCTMLSTTHDSFASRRFVVELCICAQFFTLLTSHAQQIVHNCSKSDKFINKCTIAQYCALSEYCAKHNCAFCPRVLSIAHIYLVMHINCEVVHYFEQIVPTLNSMYIYLM